MSYMPPAGADRRLPRSHLLVLNRSFRRTLEAENKSPRTMQAYTDAVRLLATYCQAHSQPLLVNQLQREHIQSFIADQLARWKPATAHDRYRGLHAFFKWAVAEGDLETSPMDGMRPPQLPDQPIDVVRPEHLARLLKTCGACSRQPCPLVSADRLETQVDATRLAVCQHAEDQARGGCGPGPEATESAS